MHVPCFRLCQLLVLRCSVGPGVPVTLQSGRLILINHTILVRFPILVVIVVFTISIIVVSIIYILTTTTQGKRFPLIHHDVLIRFPIGLVVVVVIVIAIVVVVIISIVTTAALSKLFLLILNKILLRLPIEIVLVFVVVLAVVVVVVILKVPFQTYWCCSLDTNQCQNSPQPYRNAPLCTAGIPLLVGTVLQILVGVDIFHLRVACFAPLLIITFSMP